MASEEIERVLAPGGVAMIGGRKTVKDVPPEIDESTHHMYDASGIGAGRDTLNLVAAKELPPQEGQIGLVAFSPDGSRYAALLSDLRLDATQKAHICIAETLTNRVLSTFTPLDRVRQCRFSPNGRRLAIAYGDGTLECRSIPTGRSESRVVRGVPR